MTKEEYFQTLQNLFGDDFGKLKITMSLPKSVMKRNAERYLQLQIEQNEKRLASKYFISAKKDVCTIFVGKTYTSKVSKVEIDMTRRKLVSYNTARKNCAAFNELTFIDILSKLPENVANDFDDQYHFSDPKFQELYSDKQQVTLLTKFIEKSIKKLEKKLEKSSMLKDTTSQLKKLSGVLLDKHDDSENGIPRAMKTPEYQNILANVVMAQKVYDELEEKYNSYLSELNKLNAGEKNKNIRNRISELRNLVSVTRDSFSEAEKNLDKFKQNQKNYEDKFYEEEKAKNREKANNLAHNSAKDVLDDYTFTIDGDFVEKNSVEAKQINIAVNEFMSRFRNEVDMTLKEYEKKDPKIYEYIINISDKIQDDFGVYLNSSRSIQRAIDARIKEIKEDVMIDDDIADSLAVSKAMFKSGYDDLRKKFASMNIDIKNIGRKTN